MLYLFRHIFHYIYITFEFKDNKLPIKPVNKASQAYNLLYLF